MSVLETDLRMANYWGLNNRPDLIEYAATADEATPSFFPSGIAAVIDACGNNWGIDLVNYVEGSNNSYTLACNPGPDGTWTVTAGSDALTTRRASPEVIPPAQLGNVNGAIKVQSSRVLSGLFYDDEVPSNFDPDLTETHLLLTRGYYVATRSDASATVPSLRRKSLSFSGGAPLLVDEEVAPGVEDLQIELGVDTNGDQSADYYVTADMVPATATVVSARVWLLVRAPRFEPGFTDDRTYTYADRAGTAEDVLTAGAAYAPGDSFRRVLVSKTVQLRNTRR
jgi:type IV pilus assembly protein PilW